MHWSDLVTISVHHVHKKPSFCNNINDSYFSINGKKLCKSESFFFLIYWFIAVSSQIKALTTLWLITAKPAYSKPPTVNEGFHCHYSHLNLTRTLLTRNFGFYSNTKTKLPLNRNSWNVNQRKYIGCWLSSTEAPSGHTFLFPLFSCNN